MFLSQHLNAAAGSLQTRISVRGLDKENNRFRRVQNLEEEVNCCLVCFVCSFEVPVRRTVSLQKIKRTRKMLIPTHTMVSHDVNHYTSFGAAWLQQGWQWRGGSWQDETSQCNQRLVNGIGQEGGCLAGCGGAGGLQEVGVWVGKLGSQ